MYPHLSTTPLQGLDHHARGADGVWRRALPGLPVEPRAPAQVLAPGVPLPVEGGGATSAEPPALLLRPRAVVLRDVPEDAGVAAVVVPVHGAEPGTVLVDARIQAFDRIPFGRQQRGLPARYGYGTDPTRV